LLFQRVIEEGLLAATVLPIDQNNRSNGEASNHPALVLRVESLSEAEAQCRRLARSHYENFLVASIFLPRPMRQPFYNVYAFCRIADDLADASPSPEVALAGLERLQEQLDATFAGSPPANHLLALADTVERFALPREPFDALLSAFRQDQFQFRYETMQELLGYCRGSANPVGQIVLRLGGCWTPENASLSDEICTGLQLANFWQDLGRDYAIGRIYVPQEAWPEYGVEESMWTEATTPQPLRRLLARLCEETEQRFRRGLALVDFVPRWLAKDIGLFAHGGIETLQAIRRIDFDVLRTRPTVGKRRQLGLLARACLGRLR
jgi:squalene synthase HpnC